MKNSHRLQLTLLLAGFLSVPPCFGAPYRVRDLGVSVVPKAINALGQVAGYRVFSEYYTRAILFSWGTLIDIPPLGGQNNEAQSINLAGDVVGTSDTTTQISAFLYSHGRVTQIVGPVSRGWGINDLGQIVGEVIGPFYGFLYDHGRFVEIPELGPYGSSAVAINNRGEATGWSIRSDLDTHAYLYSQGSTIDLGTLGTGSNSIGRALNNLGQVVGGSLYRFPDTDSVHPFLYADGVMHDLGSISGDSEALSINNRGEVVGNGAFGWYSPFYYKDGVMKSVNSLLVAGSPWDVRSAFAINDLGEIVGVAMTGSVAHGVIISPPLSSSEILDRLQQIIPRLGIGGGPQASLLAKLKVISSAIDSRPAAACNVVRAFEAELKAQAGKAVPTENADYLLGLSDDLSDTMACAK